jgi:energy-converting hydrogenase Eha subunit A
MAPKEATESMNSPLVWRRQTSATESSGFNTPVLVSQCTIITCVIAGSATTACSNIPAVGGANGAVRITAYGVPRCAAISISRSP